MRNSKRGREVRKGKAGERDEPREQTKQKEETTKSLLTPYMWDYPL
jgi:hypothetical protein